MQIHGNFENPYLSTISFMPEDAPTVLSSIPVRYKVQTAIRIMVGHATAPENTPMEIKFPNKALSRTAKRAQLNYDSDPESKLGISSRDFAKTIEGHLAWIAGIQAEIYLP